jgi:hypothetical protein
VDDASAALTVPQLASGLTAPGAGGQREVVAQACAMAVADAVAYLRNTEIIATAVVGAAMERMLLGLDVGAAQAALEAAQNSVTSAAKALEIIADMAAHALQDFPAPTTDDGTAAPPA